MPNTQRITIHGVEVAQTQLQGKWYTPVDGRVKIAEQADPAKIRRDGAGYHVVSVQIMQVGDRWAYHCMVEYPAGSGVVKPGTDFIDMKDSAGIAKAETSAIGRALGLHGIACEESIASADEMTQFAPEMDEGERVVDSPENVSVRAPQPNLGEQRAKTPPSTSAAPAPSQRVSGSHATPTTATNEQKERMRRCRNMLRITDASIAKADDGLNQAAAEARIKDYERMLQMRVVKTGASA